MAGARDWLRQAEARLDRAGVDSPGLSAQLILAHAMAMSRERMYLELRTLAPDESQLLVAHQLLARREQGEPVAYLLGHREFYGLDFRVTPDVLIPRPETELLVEQGLSKLQDMAPPDGRPLRFADLGAGSGALAVALAVNEPRAHGVALDLSSGAVRVARSNALDHGVERRLVVLVADFARLPLPESSLDLVVSNPPYVSRAEFQSLSREVRDHEPESALVPDADRATGLEDIRKVSREGWRVLGPGGWLLVEMGCTQAGRGMRILREAGSWSECSVLKDLAGLDRVLMARK